MSRMKTLTSPEISSAKWAGVTADLVGCFQRRARAVQEQAQHAEPRDGDDVLAGHYVAEAVEHGAQRGVGEGASTQQFVGRGADQHIIGCYSGDGSVVRRS